MIKITIYRKPEGLFKGFQVIGHADSVEEGADLVCCAVSVLTINLVNSLEKLTEDRFDLTQEEALGLVQVTFRDPVSERPVQLRDRAVNDHLGKRRPHPHLMQCFFAYSPSKSRAIYFARSFIRSAMITRSSIGYFCPQIS